MDSKGLSPRSRNQRNTEEGSSRTHLEKGEEKWLELSTPGTEQASTRSKRTILLRGTKALTVRRLTGARNRGREEEEGGQEKKRENRAWPFSDWKEAQEGKGEREEGLKKAPSTEGQGTALKGRAR